MSAIQTSSTVGSRSQLVFEILVSDNPELYLRVCVVLKRFDLADALLENGLTLSIVDSAELSLFHVAALVSSDISICEFLAQRGAPINYMDVSGYTPLDYAIQKKNLEMIRYLLAMGAKKSADLRSVKHHGLGVRLNVQKDHLYAVESFREMSPARESGLIQVGDTISKIDRIDLKGRSIFFITQRIAGNIGTEIVLELIDPQGATRTCVLNRGIYN